MKFFRLIGSFAFLFPVMTAQALPPDLVIPVQSSPTETSSQRRKESKAFNSSTVQEIELSKCKTQIVPSTSDLRTELAGNTALIENAFRDFKIPKDKLSSTCKSSFCQLKTVFGEALAYRLLFLYRLGFNGSQYIYQNAQAWTVPELNDVIAGVLDLPLHHFQFKNKQLSRFEDGYTLAIYGEGNQVEANALILVFQGWKDQPAAARHYTIFHEIAHNMDDQLGVEALASKNQILWNRSTQMSEYSGQNLGEDIADSISGYRYSPGYLKTISKEKYQWLRDTVFGGIQYNKEEECSLESSSSLSSLAAQLFLKLSTDQKATVLQYKPLSLDQSALNQVRSNCFQHYFSENESLLNACLELETKKILDQNIHLTGVVDFTNAWGPARQIQLRVRPKADQPFALINAMIAGAHRIQEQRIKNFKGGSDPRSAELLALLKSDLSILETLRMARLEALEKWNQCAQSTMFGNLELKLQLELSKMGLDPMYVFQYLKSMENLQSLATLKRDLAATMPPSLSSNLMKFCEHEYRLNSELENAPPRIRQEFEEKFYSGMNEKASSWILSEPRELKMIFQDLKRELQKRLEIALKSPRIRVMKGTEEPSGGQVDERACTELFPDALRLCREYLQPVPGKKEGQWVISQRKATLQDLFQDLN